MQINKYIEEVFHDRTTEICFHIVMQQSQTSFFASLNIPASSVVFIVSQSCEEVSGMYQVEGQVRGRTDSYSVSFPFFNQFCIYHFFLYIMVCKRLFFEERVSLLKSLKMLSTKLSISLFLVYCLCVCLCVYLYIFAILNTVANAALCIKLFLYM